MNRGLAKEKIRVRPPDATRWKKVVVVFDQSSAHDHIRPELLNELGMEFNRVLEETVTLHLEIMGDEYSWKFRVSDLDWGGLGADVVLGVNFMKTHGIILKPTPKGLKAGYATGYPQNPVI